MSKEIEFKCPHCGGKAFYYGGGRAACLYHGWLLYTDIPAEIYTPSNNWLHLTASGDFLRGSLTQFRYNLVAWLAKFGGK